MSVKFTLPKDRNPIVLYWVKLTSTRFSLGFMAISSCSKDFSCWTTSLSCSADSTQCSTVLRVRS